MAAPAAVARGAGGRFAPRARAHAGVVVDRAQLPRRSREVLAEAVAARRRVSGRAERLRAAVAEVDDALFATFAAVRRAEAALAEAELGEPRRVAAAVLGEEAPPGPSIAEARAALAEAHDRDRQARERIATLRTALADATSPMTFAEMRVREALVAVLDDERAIAKLLAAYDRYRSEAARIAAVLRQLGPGFVGHENGGWEHPDRPVPAFDGALAGAWWAALAALERGEVETPLPDPELKTL